MDSEVALELIAGREPFFANRMLVHLLSSTITKGEIKGRGQGPKSVESTERANLVYLLLLLYTEMKWHLLLSTSIVFSLPHIGANEVSPQW